MSSSISTNDFRKILERKYKRWNRQMEWLECILKQMENQKTSQINSTVFFQKKIRECSGKYRDDDSNQRYMKYICENMPNKIGKNTIAHLKKMNLFLRDTIHILKEKLDELKQIEHFVYNQKRMISVYMSLNYPFDVSPQQVDAMYGIEDWETPQDPHQYDHIDLP